MNKANLHAFLQTIESNLPVFVVSQEQFIHQEMRLIVAILDPNGTIVDVSFDYETMPSQVAKEFGFKQVVLGMVISNRLKVSRAMNEVMKKHQIDLVNLARTEGTVRQSLMFRGTPEQAAQEAQATSYLQELFSQGGSLESIFSQLMGEECVCGQCGMENQEIDWNADLYNAYGPVKYIRKEGDEVGDTRRIKFTYEGEKMIYPVESSTGMPIFEGMSPEAFAISNQPPVNEAELNHQREIEESVALQVDQLKQMFPDKADMINEFASNLRH